jgi:outer membrane protein OmpA-like peptidoglycan-associated protein
MLHSGTYIVSGNTSDATGDAGTWTFSLQVTAVTITQTSATTGTVGVAQSGVLDLQIGSSDVGAQDVSYVAVGPTALLVSTSGEITSAGLLAVGVYVASGTTSDALGDTGVWTLTVYVTDGTLTQLNPLTVSTREVNSTSINVQLLTKGSNGNAVRFTTTAFVDGLSVSTSGLLTSTGVSTGEYVVSGTATDGSNNGVWSITAYITSGVLTQTSPTFGATTTGNSAAFVAQLSVTGASPTGAVYSETSSAHSSEVLVSSSGRVSVRGGGINAGDYSVSGTLSDSNGDSGVWTYTLHVTNGVITQLAPTTLTVIQSRSSAKTVQLLTAGSDGSGVTFTRTSSIVSGLAVSSSGLVTLTGLTTGVRIISGTMSDATGDVGTWILTVTVTNGHVIDQLNPSTGAVLITEESGFGSLMLTSGSDGGMVTFTVLSPVAGMSVSAAGDVSVTGVSVGEYTISGYTSDVSGNAGVWSFVLNVADGTITQTTPTSGSVVTTKVSSYRAQLRTSGAIGAVTFSEANGNDSSIIAVSSSGAITIVPSSPAVGRYTANGYMSDGSGNSGAWTYMLYVNVPGIIRQESAVTKTLSASDTAAFTATIAVSGTDGDGLAFSVDAPVDGITVSAAGVVSAFSLKKGKYSLTGSVTDSSGSLGTWAYELVVTEDAVPVTTTTAPVSTTVPVTATVPMLASFKSPAPKVKISANGSISFGPFPSGKAAMTEALIAQITLISAYLKTHKYRRIILIGHTDSRGSNSYNFTLGMMRAVLSRAEFKKALKKIGLNHLKVFARTAGETGSLAKGMTQSALAKNRRVEVLLRLW